MGLSSALGLGSLKQDFDSRTVPFTVPVSVPFFTARQYGTLKDRRRSVSDRLCVVPFSMTYQGMVNDTGNGVRYGRVGAERSTVRRSLQKPTIPPA